MACVVPVGGGGEGVGGGGEGVGGGGEGVGGGGDGAGSRQLTRKFWAISQSAALLSHVLHVEVMSDGQSAESGTYAKPAIASVSKLTIQ